MSRVGKLPINIPQGVSITLDDPLVTVKGPKGTLARTVPGLVRVEVAEGAVHVKREDDSNQARSLHGLVRALVNNMVQGVSQGFSIVIEIQGTGYRAEVQGERIEPEPRLFSPGALCTPGRHQSRRGAQHDPAGRNRQGASWADGGSHQSASAG